MLQAVKTSFLCTMAAVKPPTLDLRNDSQVGFNVLTWTNNDTYTTLQVFRSSDGVNYTNVQTLAGNVTTWTDPLNVLPVNVQFFWKIRATGAGGTAFSNIISIFNNYVDPNDAAITAINFPTLRMVYVNFDSQNCANLASVSMPILRNVTGELRLHDNPSLVTLNLPQLYSVGTFLYLYNSGETTISLPALFAVGQSLAVSGMPNLTMLNAPLFQQGGDLDLSNNHAAFNFNLPNLTVLTGNLTLSACVFGTVDLSSAFLNLNNVVSIICGGGNITKMSFPLLAGMTGCNISGVASLVSLGFGNGVWVDSKSYLFTGCGLNAAAVNQILHICVASGLAHSVINLTGGTNSPPTGQGLTDRATLQAQPGNTCTTN
jgi:hypothetical protein